MTVSGAAGYKLGDQSPREDRQGPSVAPPVISAAHIVGADLVLEAADVGVLALPRGVLVAELLPLDQVLDGAVTHRAEIQHPVDDEPVGPDAVPARTGTTGQTEGVVPDRAAHNALVTEG